MQKDEMKMEDIDHKAHKQISVRNHHISDISSLTSFAKQDDEMQAMMEDFWQQIPRVQRIVALRRAWQELWGKVSAYLNKDEMQMLGSAFVFMALKHGAQVRHSGEPYSIHPASVAVILASIKADIQTVIAALLHDILEDTDFSEEEFKAQFGETVFNLVNGVTKLDKHQFNSTEEYQAENLRKMFVLMAKDFRVILIKLADRLHNMRTISSHRRDKQIRISKETMEIYAPLAHRIGLYQIKGELEDISFRILDPEAYYDIKRRIAQKLPERESVIKEVISVLQKRLEDENIDCNIKGRPKQLYSTYEKMHRKSISFDQIYDLLAVRVIVDTVAQCYIVLGFVHSLWKPIDGEFNDYISKPKENGYQSLHTTVVGPKGQTVEIQIRTKEMNLLAEYGVAAHWNYKEGGGRIDTLDRGLDLIRQGFEKAISDSEEKAGTEFTDSVKTDLLSETIYVSTPQGKSLGLPYGSTPVDFAYAIHTEVGHKCIGAKVNGRIVPVYQMLKNGDRVEILTSSQGHPSRDWLKFVKAARTKSKIRSWFNLQEKAEREEKFSRGKELLLKEAKKRFPDESDPLEKFSAKLNQVARDLGYASLDELYVAVGDGNHATSAIWGRVSTIKDKKTASAPVAQPIKRNLDTEIIVEGAKGVLVVLAGCCKPIPGDEICGAVTKNKGIAIHRKSCANLKDRDTSRLVPVSWGNATKDRYALNLIIDGVAKQTLLGDVVNALSLNDAMVSQVRSSIVNHSRTFIVAEITVKNLEHLYRVIAALNGIPGVYEVKRECER